MSAVRFLHDGHDHSTFDPRVFWTVNALFFAVLIIVLVWCFRGGAERISNYISNRGGHRASDLEYLERVRERRRQEQEEKKETPEERMKSLKDSFERNKVLMVVRPQDFVDGEPSVEAAPEVEKAVTEEKREQGEGLESVGCLVVAEVSQEATSAEPEPARKFPKPGTFTIDVDENNCAHHHRNIAGDPCAEGSDAALADKESGTSLVAGDESSTGSSSSCLVDFGSADDDAEDENDKVMTEQEHTFALNALETGAPGYIELRLASGKQRTVPNCCAVCLSCYEQDETVVWSSNRACKHAFHEECVIEWLVKMQDGTHCPCCRQEFTDLSEHKPARKRQSNTAAEGRTLPSFDINVVHL